MTIRRPLHTEETLSVEDIVIAGAMHLIIQGELGERNQEIFKVLEVGVWLGAWTSSILLNVPHSRVVGIDPYPFESGSMVQRQLLSSLRDQGVEERFSLIPSWEQVDERAIFDLIHIDGLHEESAVDVDLNNAKDHLSPWGVIVVDDYRHLYFPGIASSLYSFLRNYEFRIFLATPNKAYIASREMAETYFQLSQSVLSKSSGIGLHMHIQDFDSTTPYASRTDVLEQPVIICIPQISRVRRRAKAWCPPIAWNAMARIKRKARIRFLR
jgi:hypothetical protein